MDLLSEKLGSVLSDPMAQAANEKDGDKDTAPKGKRSSKKPSRSKETKGGKKRQPRETRL